MASPQEEKILMSSKNFSCPRIFERFCSNHTSRNQLLRRCKEQFRGFQCSKETFESDVHTFFGYDSQEEHTPFLICFALRSH